MSEQDANQSNSLNTQWKKRLKELGQGTFEFEEMLRLGFIDLEAIKRFDKKMTIEESKEFFEQLTKTSEILSEVDKEIKIPDDSTAKISSSSLFGGKFLEIIPGSSETFLKDKSIIYDTQTSLSFTEMIGKMIMSSGK